MLNPEIGQTYTTRYGDATVLELRPATGGILLRMYGRIALVGLADFETWNPRLPEGNVT